jgi:hypothetical protein
VEVRASGGRGHWGRAGTAGGVTTGDSVAAQAWRAGPPWHTRPGPICIHGYSVEYPNFLTKEVHIHSILHVCVKKKEKYTTYWASTALSGLPSALCQLPAQNSHGPTHHLRPLV